MESLNYHDLLQATQRESIRNAGLELVVSLRITLNLSLCTPLTIGDSSVETASQK